MTGQFVVVENSHMCISKYEVTENCLVVSIRPPAMDIWSRDLNMKLFAEKTCMFQALMKVCLTYLGACAGREDNIGYEADVLGET